MTLPNETQRRRPLKLEYDQDVIKPNAKGKFVSVLDRRADIGWRVENISQVGEHFLVTYSRPLATTVVTTVTTTEARSKNELLEDVDQMLAKGYALQGFSTAAVSTGMGAALWYTCIWRRSRDEPVA